MSRCATHRRGLSLIEVILALAILAVAMVLLGQLLRIGGRHATEASGLTQAQLHCQSIMAEIAAGALPPDPVQRVTVESDNDWEYSVEIQSLNLEGLIAVRVTVAEITDNDPSPVSASLVRWIIDPEWLEQVEAEAAAEEAAAEAAAESENAAS